MRILVVEDDHTIAVAVRQGLEQESFAVDAAYDVDSALSAALANKYDLIIVDHDLAGKKGGLEVCRQIREAGNHTPVLLLVSRSGVRNKTIGLNAGADDYLPKPFAFEELLARVRILLRKSEDNWSTTLQYGTLLLDTSTYEVSRDGETITLSRREFALLEYLLRNAGKLLTKESIVKHVWDYDTVILSNTVEVYIGYLRNKIEKPFKGEPLIKTVRGYGYRLGKAK